MAGCVTVEEGDWQNVTLIPTQSLALQLRSLSLSRRVKHCGKGRTSDPYETLAEALPCPSAFGFAALLYTIHVKDSEKSSRDLEFYYCTYSAAISHLPPPSRNSHPIALVGVSYDTRTACPHPSARPRPSTLYISHSAFVYCTHCLGCYFSALLSCGE